jgi:formylglycine-generating enzyme required for sulfatase activity
MLPGIKVKTSPTEYFPVQAMRLQRFNGEVWEWFGETIGEEGTSGPPPPETAAAWRLL